jgi:carboxylate-amine ligase
MERPMIHEPSDPRAMAAWARWRPSASYTVGLEEEVMLLDAEHDWALARRVDEVIPALDPELVAHVSAETQNSVLELASSPHQSAGDAAAQARELRIQLDAELGPMGLRAAAAGTHPLAVWTDTRISGGDRHQAVYGLMRELARREPTFGLHVHVGVGDPNSAVTLYNRLRSHVPLLLALSANSPYWQGRDTGLSSARTPIFQAFPRVGIPRPFDSYEGYVEAIDLLLRCQAIPEPTHLWWDVRLQPRFGTVEIRIMDVQSSPEFTYALVGLVQTIARLELEEGFHTSPLAGQNEVLIENRFSASRDGMHALLIDPLTETRVRADAVMENLLAVARPHAQDLGCESALDCAAELAAGNGAQRQRAIFQKTGSLADVVAALADEF